MDVETRPRLREILTRRDVAIIGVDVDIERPQRVRAASDVLRLLVGLGFVVVGVLLATVADRTVGGAQADLIEAVSRIPSRVEQAIIGLAQLLTGSVITIVAVVMIVQRHWRRLGVLILGALTAAGVMMLLTNVLDLPQTQAAIDAYGDPIGWLTSPGFPSARYLAATAAVVTLASVWLSRPWKRALWAAVVVLMTLRALSSSTSSLDVVLAVAVGVVVGSLALVVFGAPNRAPDAYDLVTALRELLPDLRSLHQRHTGGGALTFVAATEDHEYFVKLRTPDDRSADYLARLYRSIRLRAYEVEPPYTTVQRRVEHEALVILRADAAGVSTAALTGILATEDDSAMLVTTYVGGERLADVERERVGPALLEELWTQVSALDRARIAHRNLALENVILDRAGGLRLVDFDDAELAASERRRNHDVAQVLVETSILVGIDDAVEAALTQLGPERLAAAVPLLQPLALSPAVRTRLRAATISLDELRATVLRRTNAPEVPLERLERVRPRTLLSVIALTAAFYFVLPQLANLGDTFRAFGDAEWPWLVGALVASATTYFFAALAFVGSVSEPVPFGPAWRSRLATSFTSIITPAGTGGMALGIRVLQRMGIDATAATASVGINQIAGVLVHVTLLFGFIAWTGRAGLGGFSLPDSTVLLLGIAIILGLSGLALTIRRIRNLVLQPVLRTARAAGSELAGVVRNPVRVLSLLGGSAGTTLSYVVALAASIQAFGGGLSYPQIGAAYLGASLVGNAAPTPGGLGAVEAALVAALTGFGLDNGHAVSAVLTFRLATYWIPTLPGWFVFRWMQTHDEI
ncbi:MAG TPA: lysylphosphatidylglycerol synthase transmembrane domain-containing protein [Acidimicrobiia bacterium]|nr:lysylphosphatidylglycerol synthase transmembrane domain-containing protein [Acidimicrobiia bacterium]